MVQKLTSLRPVLCNEEGNVKQFFDEFVRPDGWEMALHVVCDYLLERTAQAAVTAVIQQIEALHEAMAVVDILRCRPETERWVAGWENARWRRIWPIAKDLPTFSAVAVQVACGEVKSRDQLRLSKTARDLLPARHSLRTRRYLRLRFPKSPV